MAVAASRVQVLAGELGAPYAPAPERVRAAAVPCAVPAAGDRIGAQRGDRGVACTRGVAEGPPTAVQPASRRRTVAAGNNGIHRSPDSSSGCSSGVHGTSSSPCRTPRPAVPARSSALPPGARSQASTAPRPARLAPCASVLSSRDHVSGPKKKPRRDARNEATDTSYAPKPRTDQGRRRELRGLRSRRVAAAPPVGMVNAALR